MPKHSKVKIQILYFKGCPNHEPTVDLTRQVVADLCPGIEVEEVELTDAEDTKRLRFFGSPTVQVNGADIDPGVQGRTDCAFGCRMYGSAGVPPRELIEAAVRDALR